MVTQNYITISGLYFKLLGYLWVTFGLYINTISIHKYTLTNPLTQDFIPTQRDKKIHNTIFFLLYRVCLKSWVSGLVRKKKADRWRKGVTQR